MDDTTLERIGKAIAIANVGLESTEKYKLTLEPFFGRYKVKEIIHDTQRSTIQINMLTRDQKDTQKISQTQESESKKLRAMRDQFLAGNEANALAILSWFGFFEGGAAAHWNLLLGTAQQLKIRDLESYAQQAASLHESLAKAVNEAMKKYKPAQ